MKKYFSILSRRTKIKCAGVIALAFIGSLLGSIWPVKLGELYTNISNGNISSIAEEAVTVSFWESMRISSLDVVFLLKTRSLLQQPTV